MHDDERELWRDGTLCCVIRSCCSGAELQIRRADEVILRELYPSKSDLYERAQELRRSYQAGRPEGLHDDR